MNNIKKKNEFPKKLKTFILTNGNPHALRILEHLSDSEVKIDSVILEKNSHLQDHILKTKEFYILRFFKGLRRFLLRKVEVMRLTKTYKKYTNVIKIDKLNSPLMLDFFKKTTPDLIILGGIGILDKRIIDTAALGVLNAHPGLLPWIRGSGVIARAIERNIPVGASCHFVDSNIDTGPIIERRLLKIDNKCSLKDLQNNADLLISEMISETLINLYANNSNLNYIQQTKKYPICKTPSILEIEKVENMLQQGKAQKLFLEWKSFCIDDDKLILASNISL